MRKHYYTIAGMIQNFGILFENLKNNAEIAQEMAEYGYGETEIAQGKALYDKAIELHQANLKETKEETESYADFDKKFNSVLSVFMKDRKKGKIVFKDQEANLRTLRLKALPSKSIASLMEEMKNFYNVLDQDEALRQAISRLKVDESHIKSQLEGIVQAEKAYAAYQNEKGEAQQATKNKDAAFSELEKWVRELYSVAKIALEDKPQLLESIAKSVRS
ncbi:hypothetical protein [Capnocytophaga stomatis]|uniref:Uncharacterized protein n=1 Tax=Capnocytophaga stomatis TaxID=1848904 RepID=A0A250FZ34_9FLAO|nr:hypothetical protein [Capnocytophaga stomatis]ATA90392.1 hypothetical protein CGC58_12000 [Capnocytophaga stomatis]GIJ94157.1 hypothetical protein CAPN002_13750 [Capnocytophaga stomatis]GIJ97121.1 hypothetical protein CAPN001_16900 [Capnocytophaga stomatis]GIM49544.1 hypothetical protein CAPN003_09960 [Capnocytophaga stomatis]